ncbi:hypothetical protein MRX96_005838 [Rhipicephalus microplus]
MQNWRLLPRQPPLQAPSLAFPIRRINLDHRPRVRKKRIPCRTPLSEWTPQRCTPHPSELFGVRRICYIDAKYKLLEDDTHVGVICGVDGESDAAEIAANFTSAVPVISCVRRGSCIAITFEGTAV